MRWLNELVLKMKRKKTFEKNWCARPKKDVELPTDSNQYERVSYRSLQ